MTDTCRELRGLGSCFAVISRCACPRQISWRRVGTWPGAGEPPHGRLLFVNVVARRFPELAGKGLSTPVILEVFALSLPHIIALTLPMAVLVLALGADAGVVTGLGTIGEQTFMVIGDQPGYRVSAGYVGKRPANPGPEDFEYGVRMMQAAQRWELPIVFFTDTLGALPTMAAGRAFCTTSTNSWVTVPRPAPIRAEYAHTSAMVVDVSMADISTREMPTTAVPMMGMSL